MSAIIISRGLSLPITSVTKQVIFQKYGPYKNSLISRISEKYKLSTSSNKYRLIENNVENVCNHRDLYVKHPFLIYYGSPVIIIFGITMAAQVGIINDVVPVGVAFWGTATSFIYGINRWHYKVDSDIAYKRGRMKPEITDYFRTSDLDKSKMNIFLGCETGDDVLAAIDNCDDHKISDISLAFVEDNHQDLRFVPVDAAMREMLKKPQVSNFDALMAKYGPNKVADK